MKHLTKELTSVQQRSQKLYEAVEKGLLPMDSTLTERANKVQAGAADRDCKAATAQADASGGSWGEENTGIHGGVA